MSVITWVEGIPSNASTVGSFPPFARSQFTSIALGMATEHFFEGSGGASTASSGDLRPGGSRAFFDTLSRSSVPSQGTARAFLCSDTSRLLVYESAGTYLGGTPGEHEHATQFPGAGYSARQSGSFATTGTSGTTTVNFPVPFLTTATTPTVVISSSSAVWFVAVVVVTGSQFQSSWSALAATGGASVTFTWAALGPMSSQSY